MPKPPARLRGMALAEWNRIAKPLYDLGILTAVDAALLEMYCIRYEIYVKARDEIAQLREDVKHGKALADPDVWHLPRRMRAALRAAAAKFGMKLTRDGRMDVPGAEG